MPASWAHLRVLKPALSSTNGHWRRNPAIGQRTNLLAHPGRADLTVLAPFPPGRGLPRSPLRRPRRRTAARLAACPGRSPDRGLAWLVDTQRRRALGRADPTNCSASLASWSQSRLCRMGMVTHCFMSHPSCRGSKRAPAPEATSSSTRCFGSFTTSSPPLSMAKVLPPTLSPGEEPHPERRIARVSTGSAAPRKAELGRACPDSHPSWRPPAMGGLISQMPVTAVRTAISAGRARPSGERYAFNRPTGMCSPKRNCPSAPSHTLRYTPPTCMSARNSCYADAPVH